MSDPTPARVSHRRLRPLLARLTLLGSSVVVGLAMLEGLLRIMPERLPEEVQIRLHYEKLRQGETRTIADPYLGFVYRSNTQTEIRGADVRFRYTTDEHGFRNPSPWPPTVDVVAVGDSMVFGFGLPDDRTWARELASCLRGGMINLALPGMAPQQYSRAYERLGVALRPRVLVYGLFPANDLGDARDFRGWVKAGSPGDFAVWRVYRGAGPMSSGGLRKALRKSYLFTLVNTVRLNRSLSFHGRTVKLSGGKSIHLTLDVPTAEAMLRSDDIDLVMEAIESARTLASANSTEFLVVLFPTKEEVYLPVLGEPAPRLVAAIRSILEQRGIAHLDLTPVLQAGARQGERVFFEIDGHPNEAGNHAIAAALISRLCAGAAE